MALGRLRRSGIVVGCAVAVGLCLPVFAQGASWAGSDAASDVVEVEHSPDPAPCGTDTTRLLPDDAVHDITELRVNHGAGRVFVTVRVRDLAGAGRHFTSVTVRTDGPDYWLDAMRYAPGNTVFEITRLPAHMPPPDECGNLSITALQRPCSNLVGMWSVRADAVRFAVPRRCLSSPDWVRASASVYSFQSTHGHDVFVHDRWQAATGRRLSPRVFSG